MTSDRWELLRALGAVAADPAGAGALGLPPCGTTEHAEVFAFNCPPYAFAYLGEAGSPPGAEPEAEHLSTLLEWYARLGEAGEGSAAALFREQLWPWLPGYLGAVRDLPSVPLTRWAELTLAALRREREQHQGGPLPRALREAPPPAGPGDLAGGLVTPLRSGLILTRRAVAAAADQIGAGQRIADRRRALGVMLAARPERTARWLAEEAEHWSRRHLALGGAGDRVQRWWAERAGHTARMLRERYTTASPVGFSVAD